MLDHSHLPRPVVHIVVCLMAAWVCAAAPALANLRAPIRVDRAPSTALYPPSGQGEPGPALSALGERLVFSCAGSGCRVEAEYRVQAAAAASWTFEFVLPAGQPVTVELGDNRQSAQTVPAEPYSQREAEAFGWTRQGFHPEGLTLHRARFQGALPAGESRIRVSYFQPHSSVEHGHSYFSDGRFVDTVVYELWPLREWSRAAGFRIDLEVRMARDEPSWWASHVGTVRGLRCHQSIERLRQPQEVPGFDPHRSEPISTEPAQQGAQLVLRATLGPEIADRLACDFGDEDLLR